MINPSHTTSFCGFFDCFKTLTHSNTFKKRGHIFFLKFQNHLGAKKIQKKNRKKVGKHRRLSPGSNGNKFLGLSCGKMESNQNLCRTKKNICLYIGIFLNLLLAKDQKRVQVEISGCK